MATTSLASAGPFSSVRTQAERVYVDSSTFLLDATGGYLNDPANGGGWVSAPDFTVTNTSAPMAGASDRTQGQHVHVDPVTGTIYRFFVTNGQLFLANDTYTAFTDVTPVAVVTISAGVKVGFASVGTAMIITDGTHAPWVTTNVAANPIVGAYIDIDGAAGAWSAYGPPTIYQDAVFFITKTVPGGSDVTPRLGIVWSEPNQPTVGYTQTGCADFWNLIETGSDPLYAILGTNNGLFYWRETAIGVLAGTPSLSFSTTATRDARGTDVGSVSPWAIAIFGNNIFFPDVRGRPYLMPIDGDPQPIWEQLSSRIQTTLGTINPTAIELRAVASVVPELNQVIMATLVSLPTPPFPALQAPTVAFVFDGRTGGYAGIWTCPAVPDRPSQFLSFESLGVQRDSNGVPLLCHSALGFVRTLNSLYTGPWAACAIQTRYLGYAADSEMYPDRMTLIATTPDAIVGTLDTESESVGLSATPQGSGVTNRPMREYRAVVGLDGLAARGVSLTLSVAAPTAQWSVPRIDLFGNRSPAGVGDA